MSYDHNLVFGNTNFDYVGNQPHLSDIHKDPLFVGKGDYHLQSGSPAIDAGDTSAVSKNSADLDGDLPGAVVKSSFDGAGESRGEHRSGSCRVDRDAVDRSAGGGGPAGGRRRPLIQFDAVAQIIEALGDVVGAYATLADVKGDQPGLRPYLRNDQLY